MDATQRREIDERAKSENVLWRYGHTYANNDKREKTLFELFGFKPTGRAPVGE
jgi:hypothetical protein